MLALIPTADVTRNQKSVTHKTGRSPPTQHIKMKRYKKYQRLSAQLQALLAIIENVCDWGVNVNIWMDYCK